jgi:hypothetical protein
VRHHPGHNDDYGVERTGCNRQRGSDWHNDTTQWSGVRVRAVSMGQAIKASSPDAAEGIVSTVYLKDPTD